MEEIEVLMTSIHASKLTTIWVASTLDWIYENIISSVRKRCHFTIKAIFNYFGMRLIIEFIIQWDTLQRLAYLSNESTHLFNASFEGFYYTNETLISFSMDNKWSHNINRAFLHRLYYLVQRQHILFPLYFLN